MRAGLSGDVQDDDNAVPEMAIPADRGNSYGDKPS